MCYVFDINDQGSPLKVALYFLLMKENHFTKESTANHAKLYQPLQPA